MASPYRTAAVAIQLGNRDNFLSAVIKMEDLDEVDPQTGMTLLHMGAAFEKAGAVESLLEMGADANIKSPQGTALEIASATKNSEIIRLLEPHTS